MDRRRWQVLGLRLLMMLLACGFFAGSLPIDAVYFSEPSNSASWTGYEFLTCGWAGPCNPTPLFGWYGNPLFLCGVFFVALGRHPFVAGAGAFSFLLGLIIALDSVRMIGAGLAPNEGGTVTLRFGSFGVGYYLWLASYVVGMFGGIVATVVAVLERRRRAAAAS